MNVSLDQAIEIHARALLHRKRESAAECARELAIVLRDGGDQEGHIVWLKVADVAEALWRNGLVPDGNDPRR